MPVVPDEDEWSGTSLDGDESLVPVANSERSVGPGGVGPAGLDECESLALDDGVSIVARKVAVCKSFSSAAASRASPTKNTTTKAF